MTIQNPNQTDISAMLEAFTFHRALALFRGHITRQNDFYTGQGEHITAWDISVTGGDVFQIRTKFDERRDALAIDDIVTVMVMPRANYVGRRTRFDLLAVLRKAKGGSNER